MEQVVTTYVELFDSVGEDGTVFKKGCLSKKDEQLIINTILHCLNENFSNVINIESYTVKQNKQITNKPTGLLNEKEKRRNNR
jgi:hypothetical protein